MTTDPPVTRVFDPGLHRLGAGAALKAAFGDLVDSAEVTSHRAPVTLGGLLRDGRAWSLRAGPGGARLAVSPHPDHGGQDQHQDTDCPDLLTSGDTAVLLPLFAALAVRHGLLTPTLAESAEAVLASLARRGTAAVLPPLPPTLARTLVRALVAYAAAPDCGDADRDCGHGGPACDRHDRAAGLLRTFTTANTSHPRGTAP